MNKQQKQEAILQALADALIFTTHIDSTGSLEQRKAHSIALVNDSFKTLDATQKEYAVFGSIERFMVQYASVSLEPDTLFVKSLMKQCRSERFFQTRKDRTIFKFSKCYVTFWNDPESEDTVTSVTISRLLP